MKFAALNLPDGGWPNGVRATFSFAGADGEVVNVLAAGRGCPPYRCAGVSTELGGGVSASPTGCIRVELPPIGVALVRVQ